MMGWVRSFPDGKLATALVTVDGVSPNGEDYAIGAVTAGLRTFLERVDVKPEPAAVEV